MKWKKLFASNILNRGYDYFCDDAVENMEVSEDVIYASVVGTEEYEVEISLINGEVSEMYCSCPYAGDGNNCKHMAAVLYEWSGDMQDEAMAEEDNTELSGIAYPQGEYKKKKEAVETMLAAADRDLLASFLTDILMDNEKMLVRFHNIINGETTKEDVKRYKKQIDALVNRYLGRDLFINYYEAHDFISELGKFLNEDIQRMMDQADYIYAFELMNYIFITIGNVDMDDSDGETDIIADAIYQLWIEILSKVTAQEKRNMFLWFTNHLDGSIIDYMEEYIEQIIMEEFKDGEYRRDKLTFIEQMIEQSNSKDSEWSRSYGVGKWALRYLEVLSEDGASEQKRIDFCKKYWKNSSVRRYYIDWCVRKKDYENAIRVLNESILLDKDYRGLVSEYNKKKKEIYLLQGNKEAYIIQLWELVLEYEAGNLELYKELKKQYTAEEWIFQREELFKRLPTYAHVDRLYREEQLYDRLLEYVLQSKGLYALQEYENVLKKDYPDQILIKYATEVNKMVAQTSDRKGYQHLVSLLRRMQRIKGGSKIVEEISEQWRMKYRNRRAMIEELSKL